MMVTVDRQLEPARRPTPPPPPREHEHEEEARPVAEVLALQRGAGNHAVTRLLARDPVLDPRTLVDANPQWADAKAKPKPVAEHASRADALSYERQPEALKEVLERSFGEGASSWFLRLSDDERSNLVHTYNRMIQYGIWEHVRAIKRVVAGEAPARVGPLQLIVAGKSVSVVFDVYDGKALRDTMLKSQAAEQDPSFGKDTGPAGALHPGQTSMREFTLTTRDGLHLSIGAGTEADAHMDRVSPTNAPKGQTSQMDLVRSLEHHWQEVWPEFLRLTPGWLVRVPQHVYDWLVDKLKYLGAGPRLRAALRSIPEAFFNLAAHAVGVLDAVWAGTTFKPAQKLEHPDPSQRERDTDFVVLKEYRFGGGGRPALPPSTAPRDLASMDEPMTAIVERAVERADPGVIRPTGRDKRDGDDYADAGTVGLAMAQKILHAAKAKGLTIGVELGPLYHDLKPAEAAEVKVQLIRIGKAAREALAGELTARGDEDMSAAVLGVRSGVAQLGRVLTYFPLH